MLLAENLLLLVTDEASGRLRVPTDQLDPALAGANLVELTMMGRVDLSGEGSAGKPGRLMVCDSSPAGDEVLDAALRIVLARTGHKPSAVIRPLGRDLRRTLYERRPQPGRSAPSGPGSWECSRSVGGRPRMPATRCRCAGW